MLRNSEPRISDIHTSVMPALRLRGALKAVMPLEMASTPVSAAVPLEKACRIRNRPTWPTAWVPAWMAGGSGTAPRLPKIKRARPSPTVTNIIRIKKYVGMEKAMPDSLTPRRLISMIRPINPTAIATRQGSRMGKADTSWATPDEMDTDTVRM